MRYSHSLRRTATVFVMAVVTTVAMLAGAYTASASALSYLESGNVAKVNGSYDMTYYPKADEVFNHVYLYSNGGKAKGIKVSNAKVLKAEKHYGGISLTFKKPGKTVLKYTYKGKKHRLVFNVVKYSNPVKTFKVGSKDLSKMFKTYFVCAYDDFGNFDKLTGKVDVKSANGWKLKSIKLRYGTQKTLKNGGMLKKGHGEIHATFVNVKTKYEQKVVLLGSVA